MDQSETPGQDGMEHLRSEPRKRTLRAAKVVYGEYRYVIDCVVRDQSEHGARLKLLGLGDVPDMFYLFDVTDRTIRKVAMMWRREQEIGVHFEGEPVSIHDASDPRLARFRYM